MKLKIPVIAFVLLVSFTAHANKFEKYRIYGHKGNQVKSFYLNGFLIMSPKGPDVAWLGGFIHTGINKISFLKTIEIKKIGLTVGENSSSPIFSFNAFTSKDERCEFSFNLHDYGIEDYLEGAMEFENISGHEKKEITNILREYLSAMHGSVDEHKYFINKYFIKRFSLEADYLKRPVSKFINFYCEVFNDGYSEKSRKGLVLNTHIDIFLSPFNPKIIVVKPPANEFLINVDKKVRGEVEQKYKNKILHFLKINKQWQIF